MIRVVSENSAEEIALKRAREEAEWKLRLLAENLLRVIAGAGKPEKLLADIDVARTRYLEYLAAAKAANVMPGDIVAPLRIDHLFHEDADRPQTEHEWREWAIKNPEGDYFNARRRWIQHIRRGVLREVASELVGSDLQGRRSEQQVWDGIHAIMNARDDMVDARKAAERAERRGTPVKPVIDTARAALAEGKIEEIRQAQQAQERAKRAQEIAGLSEQQIAGLRAVEAGAAEALDMVNAFTLDVLGRMHLLAKVKGKKGKSAWVLTEDGRAALKTHENRRTAGEGQE